MEITIKPLKMSNRARLCLVIPLGDGMKVQYPVHSEAEAKARYEEYQQWNANAASAVAHP
jgi:hypothetical protein